MYARHIETHKTAQHYPVIQVDTTTVTVAKIETQEDSDDSK